MRTALATTIVAALFLAGPVIPPAGGDATPPDPAILLDWFSDCSLAHGYDLEEYEEVDDTTFTLPSHAFVHSATVNLTLSPTDDGASAAWDPYLDAGADGDVEWRFDSHKGGAVGRQVSITRSFANWNGSLTPSREGRLWMDLPRGARIREASLELVGHPVPHWLQMYNLTPDTVSPYESAPDMKVYKGQLYTAWCSSDPNITGGEDSDVVYRRWNGVEWEDIVDISDPDDGWTDGGVLLETFDGKLYAIWRRGDGMATHGGHNEVVYKAYDGSSWSSLQYVSRRASSGLNTFQSVTVHNGRLWVAWKTTDPLAANIEWNGADVDMVIRAFDGQSWGDIQELTYPNNTMEDWSIDLCSFGGRLYTIWGTWEPNITGWRGNKDVVLRSYDGTSWSTLVNLSPWQDRYGPTREVKDSLPELAAWYNPATKKEELFAYWLRGASTTEDGEGNDLVYRRWSNGRWGPMEALSEVPEGEMDQMFPDLVEYQGMLYAIWVLGTNVTVTHEGNYTRSSVYGNIMLRTFDGLRWSNVMELTQMGNGFDNAAYPTLCRFEDMLWAGWKANMATTNDTLSWEVVVRPFDATPVEGQVEFAGSPDATWGWQNLTSGFVTATVDPGTLTAALDALPVRETDGFGNAYLEVPIVIRVDDPANVVVQNLSVLYDYTVTVDVEEVTSAAVAALRDNSRVDLDVVVPLAIHSEKPARAILDGLRVEYHLDYPPFLLEPVPALEMEEDSEGGILADMEEYFSDDWDDGRLTFSVTSLDGPQVVLDAMDVHLEGSHLHVGPPPADWYGNLTARVRAFDTTGIYHNDSNEFVIAVTPVNDPPDLEPVPRQTLDVDDQHIEQLVASDIDDPRESLRYSADTDLVEVDPVTGKLKVTIQWHYPQPLVFNVTVTDPHGASDSEEVTYDFQRTQVQVEKKDYLWIVLIILAIMAMALVAADRIRRRRRLTVEETIWDEEAAHEERRLREGV